MVDHRTKKELIDLNEEFENYFRNTIIPQLFVDSNLVLRKFTPPAMKQFNLNHNDIGKSILDIQDNFRFPSLIENIQDVINNNEILEKEIQTTDLQWYQMNVLPYVRQKDNVTNGVIITFVDITRRIKDLKELEKLITNYETLLDTISHDLKNPLNNLKLAMSQLKSMAHSSPKAIDSLMSIAEIAFATLQNVILDLIDSRERDYRSIEHDELINIEHVLEDACLALNEEIKESGSIIKTDVQVSQIVFSRRKLRSIIYNILSNSIKYRSPSRTPEIFVRVLKENKHVIISIKDNGIGIDPSNQAAVFSKYFRVNNKIEGSGIGLFIIRELVNNTGGKVQLESEPNKGTEVTVYIKGKQ